MGEPFWAVRSKIQLVYGWMFIPTSIVPAQSKLHEIAIFLAVNPPKSSLDQPYQSHINVLILFGTMFLGFNINIPLTSWLCQPH
jgi:hypothetical protein